MWPPFSHHSKGPNWLFERIDHGRRILRLFRRHHRILIRSFLVLAAIRWRLGDGSHRFVQGWIESRAAKRPFAPISVPVAAWSVSHAARLVPGAACLAQAFALKYLLLRGGEPCTIRIGVKTSSESAFAAHAWVVYKGQCILGGHEEDLRTFSQLVDL